MKERVAVFGLLLLVGTLASTVEGSAKSTPGWLREDEYATVALIYNAELSALGERALYLICLDTPAGVPAKPLVRYLRRGGYTVSDPSVCTPPPQRGDYPHGMVIYIGRLERGPGSELDIHVETNDNTLHYGVHLAILLRRGTYHFKQNEKGEWGVVGYTKEYDFSDEKPTHGGCNPGSC